MKVKLFAAASLFLASCASPNPYPSGGNPGRISPNENPSSNEFSRDAVDCERKAALAGTGGKAAAFDSCMRAKGHTLNR